MSLSELPGHLPAVNAVLNGTSAVLLACGYVSIRRRRVAVHRALMIAAFAASTLFLASYLVHKFLVYMAVVGHHTFPGKGWVRPLYFVILTSHTILAAAIVPLAIMTLSRGLRARHPAHERLARWTLPLWFYVSVTGVVIYFMLYRLYPGS